MIEIRAGSFQEGLLLHALNEGGPESAVEKLVKMKKAILYVDEETDSGSETLGSQNTEDPVDEVVAVVPANQYHLLEEDYFPQGIGSDPDKDLPPRPSSPTPPYIELTPLTQEGSDDDDT